MREYGFSQTVFTNILLNDLTYVQIQYISPVFSVVNLENNFRKFGNFFGQFLENQ